jgi:hypothetical protein
MIAAAGGHNAIPKMIFDVNASTGEQDVSGYLFEDADLWGESAAAEVDL